MAYVGGSPMRATDPSGMKITVKACDGSFHEFDNRAQAESWMQGNPCGASGASGVGGGAGSGGGWGTTRVWVQASSVTVTCNGCPTSTNDQAGYWQDVLVYTAQTNQDGFSNNGHTFTWGDNSITQGPLSTKVTLNNKNTNLLIAAGTAAGLAAGAIAGPLALIPGVPTVQLMVGNADGKGVDITYSPLMSPFYQFTLMPFWVSSR